MQLTPLWTLLLAVPLSACGGDELATPLSAPVLPAQEAVSVQQSPSSPEIRTIVIDGALIIDEDGQTTPLPDASVLNDPNVRILYAPGTPGSPAEEEESPTPAPAPSNP